ncbi:MAG: hypothetical protein Q8881_03565 [Sweet potato little leaf phytoplasma]|nr:hypothetical protein [Sweet potato little leaf phytoplasma]
MIDLQGKLEDTKLEEKEAKEEIMDEELPKAWANNKNHPIDQVTSKMEGVKIRRGLDEHLSNSAFISLMEPKNIKKALEDDHWVMAMQE